MRYRRLPKTLVLSLSVVFVLTVAAPARAQAAAAAEPLVLGILKLVLPLADKLLGKIFNDGKDKKNKEEVKTKLEQVYKEMIAKKGELDGFIGTLDYWQQFRVVFPIVREHINGLREDVSIVKADRNVAGTVWPFLKAKEDELRRNVPTTVPQAAIDFENSHPSQNVRLSQLILELNTRIGELHTQVVVADGKPDKGEAIAAMDTVSGFLGDLSSKLDTQISLVGGLVVGEYKGFSAALAAPKKEEKTVASTARPSKQAARSFSIIPAVWAQEPPRAGDSKQSETLSIEGAEAQLRAAMSEREKQRIAILNALKESRPEQGIPAFLFGVLGAGSGLVGGGYLGKALERRQMARSKQRM